MHPILSQKSQNQNSSPWFDSIRDKLLIAKRERCQAERKLRNTKLTIFKGLYRQAKHKAAKLVHTAKYGILYNNGRQRFNIHGEKYRAKN